MPADITIFTAKYLVFIEALIVLGVVGFVLYHQSRDAVLRWVLAIGITAVLAEIFAQIGAALYGDPRPFTVDHVRPLIPHAVDNGFPSDHALLAALLVVCVLLARTWLVVPLIALLAVLVDWARVGAGIHHPIDVIGSTLFVALAAAIAVAVTPLLVRWISPHLPRALSGPEPLSQWRRSSTGTEAQTQR